MASAQTSRHASMAEPNPPPKSMIGRLKEIIPLYLYLGVTSFGGPSVHVVILREVFVVKRKWLDEAGSSSLECAFTEG